MSWCNEGVYFYPSAPYDFPVTQYHSLPSKRDDTAYISSESILQIERLDDKQACERDIAAATTNTQPLKTLASHMTVWRKVVSALMG